MDQATKSDLAQLKEDIGEMLTQQTAALFEHINVAKKELKHDMMDGRADVSVEIKQKIGEHVTALHA